MKQITIPFKAEMIDVILKGIKTCTSRNKKYGDVGDYFIVGNKKYKLTLVIKIQLHTIATLHYAEEGFETPQDFVDLWKEIHPILGFTPNKLVWAHFFDEIK